MVLAWLLVVLDQRAASGRGLFRSATARGWGATGQGLSSLHETRTFVEYTRMSASRTPPSWSTPTCWRVTPKVHAAHAERHQGDCARPFGDAVSPDIDPDVGPGVGDEPGEAG